MFAGHLMELLYSIKLSISNFSQMGLGPQGGGNTQTSGAAFHLMQEKMSVGTGGHGRAAAAWRMRGTACQSGVWRMPTRRQAPSTHPGLFCHSR